MYRINTQLGELCIAPFDNSILIYYAHRNIKIVERFEFVFFERNIHAFDIFFQTVKLFVSEKKVPYCQYQKYSKLNQCGSGIKKKCYTRKNKQHPYKIYCIWRQGFQKYYKIFHTIHPFADLLRFRKNNILKYYITFFHIIQDLQLIFLNKFLLFV